MQTESVKICPVCKGAEFKSIICCEDYTYSHKQFTIQACVFCGLQLTNPRPDQNSISEFYGSDEYISHTGESKSIFDLIYLKARRHTLDWKQKLVSAGKNKGTILDFGSGTGEFLSHMALNDWKAFGVEPSDKARKKAEGLPGNKQLVSELESLPERKFDVITLWHVLEHVPNPDLLLSQLKSLLNKDGLIFVAVPNHESFDAQHYGKYWAAYDVPRHFWHFAQRTLERLFINQGLALQKIVPMKLDAFYVSLLSEKYKNNGRYSLLSPVKAINIALKSNSRAQKNLNYSSLIYVAKHA